MLYQIYIASVMAAIFCKESVVCGHHIYKAVWTPFVGEILDTRREDENSHDRQLHSWTLTSRVFENSMAFSAAWGEDVMRDYWQETAWSWSGSAMCLQITGRRRHGLGLVVTCVCKLLAEDGRGLGLVVPCVYKLLAEDGMVLVW